jgi:hypothetical protein
VTVVLVVLSCFAVLPGCADIGPTGSDGGKPRDATVVDAGPEPDGAVVRDGSVPDAAMPDAGPPACPEPATVDCDPVTKTGDACMDGEACLLASSEPACAAADGTGERGDPCASTEDCAPGFACFARRGEGVCGRICCGDREVCEAGERCAGPGVLVDGTETAYAWCAAPRPCDVFEPESECEPGEGCYIVAADATTDCRGAGDGETGDPCASQSDCAPGFFCGGLTAMACVRICEIGVSSGARACPSSEGMCRAYPHTPVGTGLCTVETTSGR